MRRLFAPRIPRGSPGHDRGVGTETPRIQVVPHAVAPRVDIIIDGKPFTSYIFEQWDKKPSLYPLRTAKGTIVTRGYPLDPHPGEQADHPHHVGLWFNYGDVNGLDFWNNSDAIPAARADKMGTIVHQRVIEAVSGKDKGELNVEMDWVDAEGTLLLKENTRYIFQGDERTRVIDRITRLAALKEPVVLGDNKEGVLGIRVARALEQPSKSADVCLDANNKPAAKAVNNDGVTGNYIGSDGKTGDDVWGGIARTMDDAAGDDWQRGGHHRHARPSGQSRLPHLLACARLRVVRREQPGPESVDRSGRKHTARFPLAAR